MRILVALLCSAIFFAQASRCQDEHQHELSAEEVGSVHFSTSCSKTVGETFNRAVALLHSFQYEQARQAFLQVSVQDPTCAMAQWGIAMSHYHGLWGNGDTAAGRAALEKAKDAAAANPTTTPRENAYIQALAEIYIEDGKSPAAHAQTFEQRWARYRPPTLKMMKRRSSMPWRSTLLLRARTKHSPISANAERFSSHFSNCTRIIPASRTTSSTVTTILSSRKKASAAARMYAEIAPASAHAQHMPSHLFTRVGLWDEAIRLQCEIRTNGRRGGSHLERRRSPRATASRHGLSGLRLSAKWTGETSRSCADRDELVCPNFRKIIYR